MERLTLEYFLYKKITVNFFDGSRATGILRYYSGRTYKKYVLITSVCDIVFSLSHVRSVEFLEVYE